MAKSTKGAGNLMVPLAVVSAVVVGALVLTFSLSSEDVPDEATIIAEDDVDARPAGAGTVPEGEADEEMEGISDQLDEVDPAAPDVDSVPPAEENAASGVDDATEGETAADEEVAGTDDAAVADGGTDDPAPASEGQAATLRSNDAARLRPDTESGGAARLLTTEEAGADGEAESQPAPGQDDSFLVDESSDAPAGADIDTAGPDDGNDDLPAGRDAQTDLETDPGQDVVRDDDDGGAAVIPTPSGPEGRDDDTLLD